MISDGGRRKIGTIDLGAYEMLQASGQLNYTLFGNDGPEWENLLDLDSKIPDADSFSLVSNSNPDLFDVTIDGGNRVDVTLVDETGIGSVTLVFKGMNESSVGYFRVTISVARNVIFVDNSATGANNGTS